MYEGSINLDTNKEYVYIDYMHEDFHILDTRVVY